jgi:hypothetical protein
MGHVHLKMKVLVIDLRFLFINIFCNLKHINSKMVFGEITQFKFVQVLQFGVGACIYNVT